MPSALGRILQRIQGIIDGDGVKDSSVYLQNHQFVVDLVGTDVGVPGILVRALDPRTNAPSNIMQINKDGTLVLPAVAQMTSTAPTSSAPGDAAVAGNSTDAAHRNHVHGRESFGAVGDIVAAGGAAAAGASGKVADAAHVHAVGLTSATADVASAETTTSTSYTDLSTPGPAVTLSPGATQKHLLTLSARQWNSVGGGVSFASVAVGGASALDTDALYSTGDGNSASTPSRPILASAQATGATHTMKYKVSANTGSFQSRRLVGAAI